jgi:hypothetical protein
MPFLLQEKGNSDSGQSFSIPIICLFVINLNNIFRPNKEEILILVGGWNGKKRSNSVHAFDLKDKKWIGLKEWTGGRQRVPPPVGLSSHTATAINDKLVCVLGREGGIKTQRRFGDLFLLNLDLGNIYNSFI